MNKIEIVSDKIIAEELRGITYSYSEANNDFEINKLKIKIENNDDLDLIIKDSGRINIFINVEDNKCANINQYISGDDSKIQYIYYLGVNSTLNVKQINNIKNLKEHVIVNLNGENSKISKNIKTISTGMQKIDILTYHNANKTESNIINNGVNINDGNLEFEVSSFVPKEIKESILNQENRIINLTNNKCTIIPNMFIDSYDVSANHSAYIGTFRDDELFYMQSRGLTKEMATKLLIRGFLINDLAKWQEDIYNSLIDEYWG